MIVCNYVTQWLIYAMSVNIETSCHFNSGIKCVCKKVEKVEVKFWILFVTFDQWGQL